MDKKFHFRYLRLQDQRLLSKYISSHPGCSQIVFPNLYSWRFNGLKTQICEYSKDLLILKSCDVSRGNYNYILLPLKDSYTSFDDIIDYLLLNKLAGEVLVPEDDIQKVSSKYSLIEDNVNNAYIYSTQKLSTLSGNKLATYRANVNKFTKQYPSYEIEIIEKNTLNQRKNNLVKELFQHWIKYKNGLHPSSAYFELESLHYYLKHFKSYNGKILTITYDQRLIAFGTVEIDKEADYGYVFYAKSDHAYKGVSEMLIWEISKYLASQNISFLNFEEDLGIENLRKFKLKLRPAKFYKLYKIVH